MFMPTSSGIDLLNVNRPVHAYGHRKYNEYVQSILDDMLTNRRVSETDMCELNIHLRHGLRSNTLPWI